MDRAAVLIVDDDPEIRKIAATYLTTDGYTVHSAGSGMEALHILKQEKINLILLDMILPDMNGLELLKRFREGKLVPVIVISGKSDPADRVIGLEMGADDYLPKPFLMRELSARIKSVLRRFGSLSNEKNGKKNDDRDSKIIVFGSWKMDIKKYEVYNKEGKSARLTHGEFRLLHALIKSPRRVLNRQKIFEITRDKNYDIYDRAVDIQIGRLRKKLDESNAPSFIKTIRGVGYMFIGNVSSSPVRANS